MKDETDVALQSRTRTLADTIASRTADWLFDGCLFLFFSASAYGFSFFYSYKGHDGDCVTLLIPIPAHLHYPSRQEDHLSHSHRSGQLTWLSCANLYSRANYTHSHTLTLSLSYLDCHLRDGTKGRLNLSAIEPNPHPQGFNSRVPSLCLDRRIIVSVAFNRSGPGVQ